MLDKIKLIEQAIENSKKGTLVVEKDMFESKEDYEMTIEKAIYYLGQELKGLEERKKDELYQQWRDAE